MNTAFMWIGVVSTAAIFLVGTIVTIVWLYANFVHNRFGLILFRKGERRISIASWHRTKRVDAVSFKADDWPIGARPFYLSYRFNGERRVFVMLGIIERHRNASIEGEHP